MDQKSINDKLDYLPVEIIECLTADKSFPIVYRESLLPQNNKKNNLNKESKISKFSKYVDITSLRGEQIDKLNVVEIKPIIESIIPTSYWIIKEDLRRFIEYNDREFESLKESGQNQIVFPTEYPHGRHEVKCLQRTLRLMLDENDGPDIKFDNFQIHSRNEIDMLSEYVTQQEAVYNVILHELGRQMMATSSETGSTVMELRKTYTDLVNKIPEELMRLKDEVKEQFIRDSKLLSQIEDFQAGIIYLTDHLREVKNQDIKVTKDAETLQKELEAAMQDSARSKELLTEYHVLYDLQRQRLDQQMSSINIEKEEWSSLAFALALKISDESLLNTTKRLRLITKKLIQLSQHFSIYISDCDTVITTKIQDLSDRYLKTLSLLNHSTNNVVNKFFDLFHFLKQEFEFFAKKQILESKHQLNEVLNKIVSLKGFLGHDDLKKFMTEISSENVGNYETDIASMNSLVGELESLIGQLSDRRGFQMGKSNENSNVKEFSQLFTSINEWNQLISSKLKTIANFQYFFTDFQSKVNKIESEIVSIIRAEVDPENEEGEEDKKTDFDNISLLIDELYIETFECKEFATIEKNEDYTGFIKFSNGIEKSMGNFRNQIDGFDASIIESINKHLDSITHWLVDIIFLLTTKLSECDNLEVRYKQICETFAHLISLNGGLYEYVSRYTEKFITMSESDQSSRQLEIEEYRDENQQWSDVAEILIRNIGEKIEEELVKRRRQSENIKDTINMDNIDELLEGISAKSTDNNIYLSIKSVRNLKSELESTQTRINEADESKRNLLTSLQETLEQVKEYEGKIEELTREYCEYTKQ